MNQLFDLHGKAALVTGGGRDWGRAMAIALAEPEPTWRWPDAPSTT